MKTERFKTVTLALSALLAITAHSRSELDLGSSTSDTPYDRWMQPVRQVLESTRSGSPSLSEVNDLMRVGRSFRYEYTQPYVAASPAETAERAAGDCKDKTLWLARQMNSRAVRFVVGLRHPNATKMHAWLLWEKSGQYYVLDCTYFSRPIPVDSLLPGEYTPKYSWSSNGEYRHTGASESRELIAGQPKTHFHEQYQVASQQKPRFAHQYQTALRQTSASDDRHRLASQQKPPFRNDIQVALRRSSPLGDRHHYTGRRKPHFRDHYPIALRQVAHVDDRRLHGHRKTHFHDRYRVALRQPEPIAGRHYPSSHHKPLHHEGQPVALLPESHYLAMVRQRRW